MPVDPRPDIDLETCISQLARLERPEQLDAYLEERPGLRHPEVVERLAREVSRMAQRDLRQAERLARAARRLAETVGDDVATALSLRATAHVAHLSGGIERASTLYLEALEHFRRQQADTEIAVTLSAWLQVLGYLGRYEEAFEAAREAREILAARGDRLRLARLASNEANLYYRQDRMVEALERYQQSLRDLRAHAGSPQDVAAVLYNIAVCQISLHDFTAAESSFRELGEHCARYAMPLLAARAEYNIAYLHYQRGEYTRAIELYKISRERCDVLGDPYHRALCDMDQAEIYLELNLTEESERLARLAFGSFQELHMGYEAAKSLAFLAVAASQAGKPFAAIELFDQARERFSREGNLVWTALIDLHKALIYSQEQRSFQAKELAMRALEFFRGSAHSGKAILSELLLARTLLQIGDSEEALEACRSALDKLDAGDPSSLGYKGYLILGQIQEARADFRAAGAAYREARRLLENLRSDLRAEELKIPFPRNKQEIYDSLIWMTLEGAVAEENRRAVLSYMEEAKARQLTDLLAFRAHSLPPTEAAHSHLVDTIRQLREELNWYYRQIDLHELQLFAAGGADGDKEGAASAAEQVGRLRERSRRYEDKLLRTLGEVRNVDAEFGSLQVAGTLDLEQIRAALPPDSLLLEYHVSRGTLYVAVLGRKTLEIVPLTSASRVREIQRLFQFQLSKFRLGRRFVSRFESKIEEATRTHLGNLYTELLGPIEPLLEAEHLIVVPHGSLHYLPLHALMSGDRYLMDRFTISYAPSASVYAMCEARGSTAGERSLVLGIPDRTTPGIEDEVRSVATVLPGADLFLGAEATEARLRSLGRGARCLHIATHGLFRQDNPMFSSIQLGDARVSLFDLYQLELNSELVVLSGCGSGLNALETGDELIGLSRGLLYAGARSILLTLWDTHDRGTCAFMASFYGALEAGCSRAEALQTAALKVRETHPHPYFWAPYVLIGKPFST